jgi:hypothetical protein
MYRQEQEQNNNGTGTGTLLSDYNFEQNKLFTKRELNGFSSIIKKLLSLKDNFYAI